MEDTKMKKHCVYIILLGFILACFSLHAQTHADRENPLLGMWKVTQVETFYQDDSGVPYRDTNIERDKMSKDIDVKIQFEEDQLSFIMHNGKDTESVSYQLGEDSYTILTPKNEKIHYQYTMKGKTLIIEKTDENVRVFEDSKVPKVYHRFVLKRSQE